MISFVHTNEHRPFSNEGPTKAKSTTQRPCCPLGWARHLVERHRDLAGTLPLLTRAQDTRCACTEQGEMGAVAAASKIFAPEKGA